MKIFLAAILLSSFAFAAPAEKKKTLPVTDAEATIKKEQAAKEKLKALNIKDEEDCDEKAKKPVEIVPETFSLGSGNAGCTLPE
jgi:cell envelope opacity-associated protein A